MKIYDKVKQVLIEDEQARNSDKYLYWALLKKVGLIPPWETGLTYERWMRAPSFETVRRTRQKLQETEPEKYGATSTKVKKARRQKQDTKGTFIYREEV